MVDAHRTNLYQPPLSLSLSLLQLLDGCCSKSRGRADTRGAVREHEEATGGEAHHARAQEGQDRFDHRSSSIRWLEQVYRADKGSFTPRHHCRHRNSRHSIDA